MYNSFKQSSDQIDSFWFANFDSPKWMKIQKMILIREKYQNLSLLSFTWANHFIFYSDSFWFSLIHDSFEFLIILICDSIRFYSFSFGLVKIRRESRFKRESWFTCESKIKSNHKSNVGESWFTHLRIIGWFDCESKANQSETRIKLVRALVSSSIFFHSNDFCIQVKINSLS